MKFFHMVNEVGWEIILNSEEITSVVDNHYDDYGIRKGFLVITMKNGEVFKVQAEMSEIKDALSK